MLKFIKGKGHQPSAERLKLQKELFSFVKTVPHGFPHRPSSLAWDPMLKLAAIGTRNGQIRVYGKPGVEFSGQHENDVSVLHLFFLPNQGKVITLLEDNTLHLWQIDDENDKSVMKEVKSLDLDGQLKKVSSFCVKSDGKLVFLGTESGNIYFLDTTELLITKDIIYQDVVMQSVPDDFKVNPGAVEAIAEQPTDSEKILIGYNRGLIVLWDNAKMSTYKTFVGSSQQLESLSWNINGNQFMSAHNDGSYITWNALDSSKPAETPQAPYGPFPCKSITKLIINTVKDGDDFIIYTGGMPRASYGDRHTLSIMSGEKHQVLDFTSRVVDFFTICDKSEGKESDDPEALVVLVEEELVAIDLKSDGWPQFRLPYLSSLHSSAITCSQHFGQVPDSLWEKIVNAGQKQSGWKYSEKAWPINGGTDLVAAATGHNLLLTGHEDGTVRFWDASGVALHHLYTLKTSAFFLSEDQEQSPSEEEEWPPFRKVGTFDPYSDDPRLAIKKTLLCVHSGILVVAGTAGQVLVLEMEVEENDKEIEVSPLNIVGDRDSFVWKGHDQLSSRQGTLKLEPGYQPLVVVQLSPPAAITALAFHTEWSLLAAGTAHGFGLFDYAQKKPVMAKCTLNPNDMTAVGDISMSRRKSFKKSLRESFRRLRKGRSQRGKREKTPTKEEAKTGSPKESKSSDSAAAASESSRATSPMSAGIEAKPVERQIEARSVEDALGSMVRCLYLAQSYIVNSTITSPTLWAGTNSGAIFVFTVSIPKEDKRSEDAVACQLGKEIQLKHRAPVIAIQILDQTGTPLPEPSEVKDGKQETTGGSHKVLICSEEQFKVFTLPSLKPFCKFKLTAHEGSRVRKVGLGKFSHRSDETYSEHCMTCLTNQGDISIFTVPDLRRQGVSNCIKREDINGISSLVFTREGHGFFLQSPCEVLRFSLSTVNVTKVKCLVELPEGARPSLVEEVKEELAEAAKEEKGDSDNNDKEVVEKEGAVKEEKPDVSPKKGDGEGKEKGDENKKSPSKKEISPIKEAAKKNFSLTSPVIEMNGDREPLDSSLIMKSITKEVNMSVEEEKRELDITVDSIKDHLANLITDESTIVMEKHEESRTIKTQETTVTMTSKTFTSEKITNSTPEN